MKNYNHKNNINTTIKPVKIDFQEKVIYPAVHTMSTGEKVFLNFPEPYYKIVNEAAIAVYGNYVEELFILKRDGILTVRDIFKNGEMVE